MKRAPVLAFLLILAAPAEGRGGEQLFQISTLGALMQGIYDGPTTVSFLAKQGNFGLGTFNRLDGEMIVLDGAFYQVTGDGRVRRAPPGARTPFAALASFSPEHRLKVGTIKSFESFEGRLASMLPSANLFYAVRLHGTFSAVRVRSVRAQRKPYRPLSAAVKEQTVFQLANIEGTMVGFWCPGFSSGVNVAGLHLHFLSADRNAGGHVLDFSLRKGDLSWDELPRWNVWLPRDRRFLNADLAPASATAIDAVERRPAERRGTR